MKYKCSMLISFPFKKVVIIFVCIIFIFIKIGASDILPGEISESVKCKDNPDETYAVYLPGKYSSKIKWPVIIAFEPAARALIPVKLFKNPAENHGYIVVCSNNSKNGPWTNVINSMKAVWKDINQRFSIDLRRIYTTGFSGGSRAASLFGSITGIEPAGIIACGAGLQEKLLPENIKESFYYGIIGLEDFNYKEFQRLTPALEKSGVRYSVDYVPGIHRWPDVDAVTRAIEWMEIDAILRNIKIEDKDHIDKIFSKLKAYAESLIESDKFYYGVLYLGSLIKHFKMLLPVNDLETKLNALIAGKKFIKFKKEEETRYKKEYQFIGNFKKVFNQIENSENPRKGLKIILNDLKVPFLISEAKDKKQVLDSYLAKRLLYEIAIKADRYSSKYFNKKEKKRSVLFSEIASETGVNQDWYNFKLASVYAAFGLKKKCFRIVKTLLKSEKNLMKYIMKDYNFNEFLKDPEFIKIFINNK